MEPMTTVAEILPLAIWPEECPAMNASTAAPVESILRTSRVVAGAGACILAVSKNSPVTCSPHHGSLRSLQRKFLESNAKVLQDCLEAQQIIVSGGVRFAPVDSEDACFQSTTGTVFVPLLYEGVSRGCMLLVFLQPNGCRTLYPGLQQLLLSLGGSIAALLQRGAHDSVTPSMQQPSTLTTPCSSRLSELKDVLQGSTCWADIGEQLSFYLRDSLLDGCNATS